MLGMTYAVLPLRLGVLIIHPVRGEPWTSSVYSSSVDPDTLS